MFGTAASHNVGVSAHATPITETAEVQEILDKFRAKYGPDDVATYYPKHDVAAEVPLTRE